MHITFRKYPKNIYRITSILRSKYKDFAHNNRKNPLNELLFIITSVKTTGVSYENTYRQFRHAFPTFVDIANASFRDLAKSLSSGGLQNIKAKSIKRLMQTLRQRIGRTTLSPLRHMSNEDCEKFLVSLPGVGKKVARCVMMYSLNRQVFPVDTHCWRISRRIGWVRPTSKKRVCAPKDMDRLQAKVPPELRFSLHVNMVSLGRKVCTHNSPKCNICNINAYCKKLGVMKS